MNSLTQTQSLNNIRPQISKSETTTVETVESGDRFEFSGELSKDATSMLLGAGILGIPAAVAAISPVAATITVAGAAIAAGVSLGKEAAQNPLLAPLMFMVAATPIAAGGALGAAVGALAGPIGAVAMLGIGAATGYYMNHQASPKPEA